MAVSVLIFSLTLLMNSVPYSQVTMTLHVTSVFKSISTIVPLLLPLLPRTRKTLTQMVVVPGFGKQVIWFIIQSAVYYPLTGSPCNMLSFTFMTLSMLSISA